MKLRFAALITVLGLTGTAGFAQRTMRTETKPAAPTTSSRAEVANEATLARRSPALRKSAQAARFQQVAVALNLNSRQKGSIVSLIRDTRQQLASINSNTSMSPEQQQQAEQAIKLGMAQKFVGMLTPEQKDDLQALLLKKKQQQNANANSSAGSSGASAPDIPSVDAPSSSDSSDSQDSSTSQNSSSDTASSNAANSGANASTTASADATSSSNDSVATASANTNATPSAPATAAVAKADVAASTSANAKPGRLSDAQLAAILNSFVQDGPDTGSAKPPQAAAGSRS